MPRQSHKITPPENRLFRIIGLMSGTSLDGIDIAFLETDGHAVVKPGPFTTLPYSRAFRGRLRAALGHTKAPPQLERDFTVLHARAIKTFIKKHRLKNIDALGFHGHTLFHAPEKKKTLQMGDGKLLARLTGIPVVYDFRTDDVKAGGQGAPLVPAYHQALAAKLKRPVAFLNIGGVANITYVGKGNRLMAFDTGPGNALLDDWMLKHTGKNFDAGGKLAARGRVGAVHVQRFLKHAFFRRKPPKSLDRDAFNAFMPTHLNAADGAATLTTMTVAAVMQGFKYMRPQPTLLLLCGGGRKNIFMKKLLEKTLGIAVHNVERHGWHGDAIEAQAFAYLAARVVLNLPISFKTTTGRG